MNKDKLKELERLCDAGEEFFSISTELGIRRTVKDLITAYRQLEKDAKESALEYAVDLSNLKQANAELLAALRKIRATAGREDAGLIYLLREIEKTADQAYTKHKGE